MKLWFVDGSRSGISVRMNEHDGCGPIRFSRLLSSSSFESRVDFVDHTIIPPGSTIGRHEHIGNEEFYFVARGAPLIRVDDQEVRAARGTVAIVRSGQSHELVNDTDEDVEILVVQIPL